MSKLIQSFTINGKIVTNTGEKILNCKVFEYIANDSYNEEIHLYLVNDKDEVVQILKFNSEGGAEGSSSLGYNLGRKLI